ncbi:MAG: hypothetical protein PHV82_15925 [Victivallaceae bacterium]|nr:hypothetical protein [Victivallaceae bacterium]
MPEKRNGICKKFSFVTLAALDAIIDRCERDQSYPFIDTKLSVISGENIYPPAPGKAYNAKTIIFSWIQGRGLEAPAGHARWLEENHASSPENRTRITKIRNILKKVTAQMEECRAAVGRKRTGSLRPRTRFGICRLGIEMHFVDGLQRKSGNGSFYR